MRTSKLERVISKADEKAKPILKHLRNFSREDVGEVWDDLAPHIAYSIGKLWLFLQYEKEHKERDVEIARICLEKWPGMVTCYSDGRVVKSWEGKFVPIEDDEVFENLPTPEAKREQLSLQEEYF
jgi:hypothetical protein